MGLWEIQAGRFTEGEAWIGRAIDRHGFPGAVHVRAGQAYESRNQFDDAVDHYWRAVVIDPDEPSVRFVLGRALYHQGRTEEARVELEQALKGPQADGARQLLILAELRLGHDGEAERLMAELDLGRLTADQARDFATALVDAERLDLGVSVWRHAADASRLASDYERLGLTLVLAGRQAEALAAFEEGVRRDGRSASLRLNLAVMLAEAGRRDDAVREAAEALRLDPNYERAKQLLAALR